MRNRTVSLPAGVHLGFADRVRSAAGGSILFRLLGRFRPKLAHSLLLPCRGE
jgi:hypothetical protein